MKRDLAELREKALSIRRKIIKIIHATKSPHIGSCLSIVEILVVLYFRFLKISPGNPHNQQRDRFILSKGHACPALYAVLAERGFFPFRELSKFAVPNGLFEQHPNMDIERGIEISSGSLGHGLSIGAGMALAGKIMNIPYRTVVLLSDGELNEGSVWEAIMFSAHHRLNNLIAIVDANRMQALGFTRDILDLEPLDEKFRAFNWHVQLVNGHEFKDILKALNNLEKDKPNALICYTIKGKGVPFMENNILWHYRAPDDDEYKQAMEELY
jgi:transketolase